MKALLLLVIPLAAQAQSAPPDWVAEEQEQRIGRWEADNAAYRSDDEPTDTYVVEWARGIDGMSLTGRLFGLVDGEETTTFWEFRQYWHPGTETFVVEQFGFGGIGVGHHVLDDSSTVVTEQTFFRRDGTASRQGHRSRVTDGVNHSASFQIEADGTWTPQRSYLWHRVEPEE